MHAPAWWCISSSPPLPRCHYPHSLLSVVIQPRPICPLAIHPLHPPASLLVSYHSSISSSFVCSRLFHSYLAIPLILHSLSWKRLLLIHQAAKGGCSLSFPHRQKSLSRRRWRQGLEEASTPEGYQPVINYSPIPHLFSVCREK